MAYVCLFVISVIIIIIIINNNNNNHSKTVRSYLPACHSLCISQTLDTRPLRLRSYPSWGVIFLPGHV